MRALTVKQPHASLIVAGLKPVENRTWPVPKTLWKRNPRPSWPNGDLVDYHSPFPFRLAIHAAKADTDNDPTIPKMAWDALGGVIGGAAPPRGVLLGDVALTGCHKAYECMDPSNGGLCSLWADWRRRDQPFHVLYHWTLAAPVALDEPIPMRGRQGLWTVPDDVLAEVAA